MLVIKDPTSEDRLTKVIEVDYQMPFTAVFRPGASHIVTVAADSSYMHLWAEDEAYDWLKVKSIRCSYGIRKMCFNEHGSLLAAIGQGLSIWTCTSEDASGQPAFTLRPRNTENTDDIGSRTRGVTLTEHCNNLSSLAFCRNDYVLTGSSLGSICLHGVPAGKNRTSYKVRGFQWCDVQQYYPNGEIACVGSSPQKSDEIASAGTDGIVIIWRIYTEERPKRERNTNIDRYCYAPGWDKAQADESINMDSDCSTVNSISTDLSSQDGEDSSAKGQEASTAKDSTEKTEKDPSVDKKDEDALAILAEFQSLQTKQKEVEKKLELIQTNVTNDLQDVRNSVAQQNLIFENIYQLTAKKIGQ